MEHFTVTKLRLDGAAGWYVVDGDGYFVSNAPYPTKREALVYASELNAAAQPLERRRTVGVLGFDGYDVYD